MTRRDAATIALLVALVALLFSDVLFFGRALCYRDITRFWYPTRKLVATIVQSGEFPSWNPYWDAGQPLAANPNYGVFYPLQWVTLLPGFDFWFRFLIVSHIAIAACGAYRLLRRWLRWESAIFGAIVFAFGGLTLSLINLLPFLYAVAWLPWIALAIEQQRYGFASLLLAFVVIVGEPIVIGEICVLVIAFARMRRAPWRSIILMFGMAVLMGAVQLLPALDLLRDSGRGRGLPFSLSAQWSTPPARLFDIFIPRFSGPAAEHFQFYWGTAKYGWLDPYFVGVYFGLLPLALALAGLILRIRGWWIVSSALALSIALALGVHTPLLKILYDAGIFRSFRYPEKFMLLGLVPLMLFSAFAFERVRDDPRIVRVAFLIAAATAACCALLLVASLRPWYPAMFIDLWGIGIHPLAGGMARLSRSVWLLGLIRSASAAGVLLLARRRSWAVFAIGVVTVDLGYERMSLAESVDGGFFRTVPRAVQTIARGSRVFHQVDWYTAAVTARRYLDLPEMYWVVRNGLYPMVGAIWNVATVMNRDFDQTFLAPATDFNNAMTELRNRNVARWYEPLMLMSAAGYRALYLPFHRTEDPRAIDPVIFVPAPTNRIFYFADHIEPSRSLDEFVDRLARGGLTPRVAFADLTPRPLASGNVMEIRQRSNAAEADVEAQGNALLVASITRHKYWRATVDGREAPLFAVNVQYQGVFIGPGRHRVRLVYRNPLLIAGGTISIVALSIVFVMMVRERHHVGKEIVEATLELRA